MFKLCRLRCEYAELHAPSSFGLNELLIINTDYIVFVLVIAWVVVKFGINTTSVALKMAKFPFSM